jgi:hypothetical protein
MTHPDTTLAAALLLALAAPAAAAPNPRKTGTITVNSPVIGATVYVDGEEVGTVPVDPFEIRFGNHVVRVVRKGLIDVEQKVVLRPDERATVDAVPPTPGALLTVATSERGGEVILDGKSVGALPIRELALPPGNHSIFIRKPDLQPYKESFLVGPHREFVLRPALKRKDGTTVGFADADRSGAGLDLDLDLDPAPRKVTTAALALDLDLDLSPAAKAPARPVAADLELDLDLTLPSAGAANDTKVAAAAPPPPARPSPAGAPAPTVAPAPSAVADAVVQPPPAPIVASFVADPIAEEAVQSEAGPPLYTQAWFWGTAAGAVAVGVAVPFLTGMTGGYREVRDPTVVCPECVTLGTVLNR